MKLVTFLASDASAPAVGELVDGSIRQLRSESMIAWLEGSGRGPAGPQFAADDVRLLAPIPVPPSYRDFLTSENHLKKVRYLLSGSQELPDYWYEAPAFYFGNHHGFHGPNEDVKRPEGVQKLDFELEIAAAVGGNGGVAGFALLNDWSARDVQAREATVGLGVHKSKDFATSFGPWLVTPDELPYRDGRLAVAAKLEVNGKVMTETNSSEQYFSWPRMLEHAGRDTRLVAGDVLASGTLSGGCLVELGPQGEESWVQPGDVVTLSAEGLGELRTTVR